MHYISQILYICRLLTKSINLKLTKMKKLFALLMVAGVVGLYSCGPSEEEQAAAEAEAQQLVDEMLNDLDDMADESAETAEAEGEGEMTEGEGEMTEGEGEMTEGEGEAVEGEEGAE